jgi:hypothetical protein
LSQSLSVAKLMRGREWRMQVLLIKRSSFVIGLALLLSGAGSAGANTLDFGGAPLLAGSVPFYGSASYENNVINSPGSPSTGSVLFDPTGPNVGSNTPWVMGGALTTTLSQYSVSWFYAGSESGYNITFSAPGLAGGTGPYTESDSNNNCVGCGAHGVISPVFMGTTQNSLAFLLSWTGGSVSSQTSSANLIYSYLQPDNAETSFTLTTDPTNWFAFGLNDSGSSDSDYDDFVGFAEIMSSPAQGPGETPLPGSLPLLATGLSVGALLFRRRRQQISFRGA